MERKLYDYFDGETMPDDCAQSIERSLTPHRSRACVLRRYAVAAAAMLVLMLAVFNADAIRVKAQEIRDYVVNALSPKAGPVGQVEEDIYISFIGVVSAPNEGIAADACDKYLTGQDIHLAEVRDGRLYFIANGENIDITDQCSMETAFIYIVEDNIGYIHYLCVGGTPTNWGEEEYIRDPALGNRLDAWKGGGGGYNTWNYETDESRWDWVYYAREQCGFPFGS